MSFLAPEATAPGGRRQTLVLALFTLSGGAALAQEVAWTGALARTLGHGTGAVALVAALFLAGLALGAAWGAPVAARARRPLALYGFLELALAVWSALVVVALPRLPAAASALGHRLAPGHAAAPFWQVLLAAPLLLPATLLMGATLPALAAWWPPAPAAAALAGGRLAAANAAGGAAGALLAVFVALPVLGTRRCLLLAAAVAAGCGMGALALGLSRRPRLQPAPSLPPDSPLVEPPAWFPALLLAAGCASLVAQVAWTRSLAWLIGSTVYTFGLILAATVASLAAGAAMAAGPGRRTRDPLGMFRRLEALAGMSVLVSVALLPLLPPWIARLAAALLTSPRMLHAAELALVTAVLGAPMVLAGAAFPLACRLQAARGRGVARGVGQASAWLTAGNVLGAALAGSFLPSLMGSRGALLTAALLYLLVAAASRPPATRPVPLWAMASVALAGAAFLAAPRWDPALMGSGPAFHGPLYVAAARASGRPVAEIMRARGEVIHAGEGPDALVTVRRDAAGFVSLQINGRTEASTGADMPSQILAAQIPLLHAEERDDVLVVGLASGVTAGSILAGEPARVRVAELAPTVVAAATSGAFDLAAGRPLADPRVELVVADVRALLLTDDRRYHVIASQPSNPWVPGVAGLYTAEFLELARGRLHEEGVLGQWVQAYGMPVEDFRRILRTFHHVFPHAALFEESVGGGDYFLVGSRRPLTRDAARLLARITPPVATELVRAGLKEPDELLARRVLDASGLARLAGAGPLLTDDDLRLAYTTPLTIWLESSTGLARLLETARPAPLDGLSLEGLTGPRRLELQARLARHEARRQEDLAFAELLEGVAPADLAVPGVAEAATLARAGLARAAYGTLMETLEEAPGPAALQVLAGDLARRLGEPEMAAFHYRTALDLEPGAAAALAGLGGLLLAGGDPAAAAELLEAAVAASPAWARAWSNLGVARRQTGRLEAAEEAYLRALDLQPALAEAWSNLAVLRHIQDDRAGAEAALRAGLDAVPADCALRQALAALLRERGVVEEAQEAADGCPGSMTPFSREAPAPAAP